MEEFKPGKYLIIGKIRYIYKVTKDRRVSSGIGYISSSYPEGYELLIPYRYNISDLDLLSVERLTRLEKLIYGVE